MIIKKVLCQILDIMICHPTTLLWKWTLWFDGWVQLTEMRNECFLSKRTALKYADEHWEEARFIYLANAITLKQIGLKVPPDGRRALTEEEKNRC